MSAPEAPGGNRGEGAGRVGGVGACCDRAQLLALFWTRAGAGAPEQGRVLRLVLVVQWGDSESDRALGFGF